MSAFPLSKLIERLMALDLAAPLTVEFAGARYQVLGCAAINGELVHIQITQVEAP